jgi:hypothetical protein
MSGLTPIMNTMIDHMQSDYMAHLSMVERNGNPQITMSCTAIRPLTLPSGRVIPFLGTVDCAYMDAVHALVPIVIFLVAVMAWPTRNASEMAKRLFGAVMILPCVVALAAPMVLVGLEDMGRNPISSSDTGGTVRALLQPFAFMEMGGRWLIPLLAAIWLIRIASMSWKRACIAVILRRNHEMQLPPLVPGRAAARTSFPHEQVLLAQGSTRRGGLARRWRHSAAGTDRPGHC